MSVKIHIIKIKKPTRLMKTLQVENIINLTNLIN